MASIKRHHPTQSRLFDSVKHNGRDSQRNSHSYPSIDHLKNLRLTFKSSSGKLTKTPRLTYMSISSEIVNRVSEDRLYQLIPMMPGVAGTVPRTMYMSQDINRLLAGPWDSPDWENRCFSLRADLERFVHGGMIPVAERPMCRGRTSYMRQLFRWRNEVWEIRSRDPQPGIRVLGRFADTDIFIALSWWFRSDLGGPGDRRWRDAIVDCKTKWTHLFPTYQPITSGGAHAYPNSYISANTYLV